MEIYVLNNIIYLIVIKTEDITMHISKFQSSKGPCFP